ncbi:hypothetical protein CVS40_10597 [Lucilia cuprina]|nr:hypothetical protein CVS40_10597 [Lucilia cuprina]KAI8117536.1 hypothetical protein CVS40_10597 [Lucilia cuprina]
MIFYKMVEKTCNYWSNCLIYCIYVSLHSNEKNL